MHLTHESDIIKTSKDKQIEKYANFSGRSVWTFIQRPILCLNSYNISYLMFWKQFIIVYKGLLSA